MLKGLRGKVLDNQIEKLLNILTLTEFKFKESATYSGGNKRKLSLAMSMIGNPPILLLDECSTGVDPVSRRFMWKFIQKTMKGRTIVLTTHSMEECEALSNFIGIMVKGQLTCFGTSQHLKNKYGKGFQIDIIIKEDPTNNDSDKIKKSVDDIIQFLNQYFDTSIIEQYNLNLKLSILNKENNDDNNAEQKMDNDNTDNLLKLSKIFDIMEKMKNELPIDSYGVMQPSLESIFLNMAKKGEQMNDNTDDV